MNNKIALITGANKGLGFKMSEVLGEKGFSVIMVCRNKERGEEAYKKLKDKNLDVYLKIADMGEIKDIENLYNEVSQEFEKLDVLINNAAINIDKPDTTIETITEEIFTKTFNVNVRGVLWMCKKFIPLLKKSNDARIINFSSGLGQLTPDRMGGYPAYSMSKTTVNAITKILADELKNTNIKVFSVDPGWVKTDLGGPQAPLSIEEGIKTPIFLATEDSKNLKSGYFYKEKNIIPW